MIATALVDGTIVVFNTLAELLEFTAELRNN
jgi:hypothetical protein